MAQQKAAVLSGYWPLMRYNPELRREGKNPFQLDSRAPSIPFKQYAYQEARYTMLARSNPEVARELLQLAQEDVHRQWGVYSNRAALPEGAETPGSAALEASLVHRATGGGRRREMIDITTTYLGLPMKSPIVASASPLCESLENIRHLEDAGAGAVVLPSLFEEQLDLESQGVDSDLSRGSESFAESLNYLPDLHTYNLGRRWLSRADSKGAGTSINSRDRQLERSFPRRLGTVRRDDGASRCGRDRVEHLRDHHRPQHHQRRRRAELLRSGPSGQSQREHSGRGEVFALFQRDRQHGETAGCGWARTDWSSSTAFTSRISILNLSKWCPA